MAQRSVMLHGFYSCRLVHVIILRQKHEILTVNDSGKAGKKTPKIKQFTTFSLQLSAIGGTSVISFDGHLLWWRPLQL